MVLGLVKLTRWLHTGKNCYRSVIYGLKIDGEWEGQNAAMDTHIFCFKLLLKKGLF